MNAQDDLVLDSVVPMSSKVGWYRDRVEAWQRGEKVAPITIDINAKLYTFSKPGNFEST